MSPSEFDKTAVKMGVLDIDEDFIYRTSYHLDIKLKFWLTSQCLVLISLLIISPEPEPLGVGVGWKM